jgi:hypothetical protein
VLPRAPATVAVAAAALLAGLTGLVVAGDPIPGERAVLRVLHAEESAAHDVAHAVSWGSGSEMVTVAAATCCLLLLVRRRPAAAAVLGASVAFVLVMGPLLKRVVARPRPTGWPLPADVSEHAYPSGHAAACAAVTLAALVLVGRSRTRRRAAVGLVLLVLLGTAWAQLALGRHHPSDLVAGWLLAAVGVAGVETVRRWSGSGSSDAG